MTKSKTNWKMIAIVFIIITIVLLMVLMVKGFSVKSSVQESPRVSTSYSVGDDCNYQDGASVSTRGSKLVLVCCDGEVISGVCVDDSTQAGMPPRECNDGVDNDGDGFVDLADDGCPHQGANDESNCGDGVCEGGESTNDCVADCGSNLDCGDGVCGGSESCEGCPSDCKLGAYCGNGICEPQAGESCLADSCPEDCAGKQTGNPANRFCCGDGSTGQNPVFCEDEGNPGPSRCTANGFQCDSNIPAGFGCCGNDICEFPEDNSVCSQDCSP